MKDAHISEFKTKRGSGLQVRVSTTRDGQKISRSGGRFYYFDYSSKSACLRAARAERDKILAELENGPKMPRNEMTVHELHQQSVILLPLALPTANSYNTIFREGLQHLADKPITEVTLLDVQLSLTKFAEVRTQAQLRRLMTVWRRIYRTAALMQIPVINYTDMVVIPQSRVQGRIQVKETDYATYQKFLQALEGSESYYAPIIKDVSQIMYYTGMRTQEAVGLYVSDIDFEAGTISIRRSVGSTGTKRAQIVTPKTKQSYRTLPLVPQLLPILDRLVSEAENDLLFEAPTGGPVDIRWMGAVVRYISKRAGLKFSLYTLRHLFSADLFRQGVNPKVIQSLMGHASANMSAYYAFTSEDERNEALLNRKPS